MAGDLAIRMDYDLDAVEDLRLAVDEACALLLPHAPEGGSLDATFTLHGHELTVDTRVTPVDGAVIDRAGFAWTVLSALASFVDVHSSDDRLAITISKRREAARP